MPGSDAFRFLGSAAFDGQAGALHTVYDAGRNVTILEGDTNGDRVADFGIELTGNITLTAADIVSGAALPHQGAGFTVPAGLTVKGTADFNHDGQIDIVVSGGGVNQLWLLNNNAVSQTIALPNDADGWTLQGIADVNGDGQKDLISTNARYNTPWVYYYNGTAQTGSSLAPGPVTVDAVQARLEDGDNDIAITSIRYTEQTSDRSATTAPASRSDVAHSMASDFEQTSLPPSDVIQAIREGSIALRVGQAVEPVIETPLWYLDEVSGNLQQFGSSDQPDAVRLAINDEPESDDAAPAAGQMGTAVFLKPSLTLNSDSPSWMQVLRDLKNRWL